MNLPHWRRHAWRNRLQTVLLLGAMASFLALLGYHLWGGDGLLPLLALGALFAFINRAASPRLVLHLYRARPIAAWEAPQLLDALAGLSRRAGLGRPPGLYYVPSRILNAFAVGGARDAAVAVTDGLLRALAAREMVAVLAHEMSHIRNHDLRVMGLADVISRVTSLLSLIGQFLLMLSLPLILWSDVAINWFAIALLVFAPHVSMLAQLGLARTREFDADLDAARLTGDPAGLARALAKIERLQGSLFERLMLPGMRLPDPAPGCAPIRRPSNGSRACLPSRRTRTRAGPMDPAPAGGYLPTAPASSGGLATTRAGCGIERTGSGGDEPTRPAACAASTDTKGRNF